MVQMGATYLTLYPHLIMNCAANMCSTGAVRSFEQRSSCLKFVVWLMKRGGHFNLLRDSCYLQPAAND